VVVGGVRPLLSAFRNARVSEQVKTPVPYSPRYASGGYGGLLAPSGDEQQMRAMGGNGTLFAIVDAFATAIAGVDWHLYRSLPPGAPKDSEREPVTAHAALDLWNQPTGPKGPYDQPLFVKTVTQHLELVGTAFVVVDRTAGLPLRLWPVMPHRMEPVPDPEKFIASWIYHGPGGEQVPLVNEAVIRLVQTPCPWDPYRGMGAVQAVMTALSGSAAAEEWHRQFFRNSARPDGVITVPGSLDDNQFDEFALRWDEAHRGVLNAHKVAFLEYGATWEPTGYSPHDMMFVDLQKYDGEKVREAARVSDTVVGKGQALNRATAEAQAFQFLDGLVVPRLTAVWKKGLLNGRLLPMYGPTGIDVEFDFTSPVPEDKEARDRNVVATAAAYKDFVDAGVDPVDEKMLRHLGLPEMKRAPKPDPPPQLPPPAPGQLEPAVPEPDDDDPLAALLPPHLRELVAALAASPRYRAMARYARDRVLVEILLKDRAADADRPRALPPAEIDVRAEVDPDAPDLSGVLADLERQLADLEDTFRAVRYTQVDSLVTQVERAVDDDDLEALAAIAVPPVSHGAGAVELALVRLASAAAERASDEVAGDVTLDPDEVADEVESMSELPGVATAVAALVAADLALSAVREAIRLWTPGVSGSQVARGVRTFLDGLKGVERLAAFGAALHRATNVGRGAAFTVALREKPGGQAVASEQNDLRTCDNCASFNGHVFATVEEALATYGAGGYPYCLGGRRCRGTWYPTWS
jgi:HK97 family phage portal protein